jgi:hypothetical protein
MSNKNRREALKSLASVFMFGGAIGTVGYIKREELAEWLPAPRRPDWKPWAMIMTTVHPEGITREQATAMNSTKIKTACSNSGLGYTKVQFSDDLNNKSPQFREMKDMLDKDGPYNVITVNNRGVVKVHKVPTNINGMIKLIEGVN